MHLYCTIALESQPMALKRETCQACNCHTIFLQSVCSPLRTYITRQIMQNLMIHNKKPYRWWQFIDKQMKRPK